MIGSKTYQCFLIYRSKRGEKIYFKRFETRAQANKFWEGKDRYYDLEALILGRDLLSKEHE